MAARVGYTRRQAETMKRKLERTVAKIEDAAAELRHTVPDTNTDSGTQLGIDPMLEEFRHIAANLAATVDRRTR